jgi:hypothetical protein
MAQPVKTSWAIVLLMFGLGIRHEVNAQDNNPAKPRSPVAQENKTNPDAKSVDSTKSADALESTGNTAILEGKVIDDLVIDQACEAHPQTRRPRPGRTQPRSLVPQVRVTANLLEWRSAGTGLFQAESFRLPGREPDDRDAGADLEAGGTVDHGHTSSSTRDARRRIAAASAWPDRTIPEPVSS